MKKLILIAAISAFSSGALADQLVKGYIKSNGTYVQPHYKTSSDNTTLNNYSTQGNTNPYTGKEGAAMPNNNVLDNPYANNNPYEKKKNRY